MESVGENWLRPIERRMLEERSFKDPHRHRSRISVAPLPVNLNHRMSLLFIIESVGQRPSESPSLPQTYERRTTRQRFDIAADISNHMQIGFAPVSLDFDFQMSVLFDDPNL
jgi:hypothetical protein